MRFARPTPLLFVSLLVCGPAQAAAADRFVSTDGSDAANDCLTSAIPCTTLGHAVAQAASGDVIKVASGRYDESLLIDSSVTLTLSGSWAPGFGSRDPATYGSRLYGSLQVQAGTGESVDVTVDGFMLTRSSGVDASSSDDGALTLRLASCAVSRNLDGSIAARSTQTSSLNLEIHDTIISKNRLSLLGGSAGIDVFASDASALAFAVADSIVERTKVQKVQHAGHGIKAKAEVGNGASVSGSVTRTRIEQQSGVGLYAWNSTSVSLSEVSIIRNHTGILYSGFPGDTLSLTNCVVARNRGGGIYRTEGGALSILDSTIRGNSTRFLSSAGVADYSFGPTNITNSVISGNRAPLGNSDDLDTGLTAVVSVDHSDIGDISGPYNDLGGNIGSDPLFASRTDDHLTAGSPAIDTGTCAGAPATDIDGDTRPTGAGCDMGADEFVP